MKKLIQVFSLCFVLFFCLSLTVFLQIFSLPVHASQMQEYDNDLSLFLQFEQSVIKLNNSDDIKSNSKEKLLLTTEIEESNDMVEVLDEEFSLKRLIIQGDLKKTYGAIDVVSYNNLHILCYSTKSETKYAFEQLSKDSSIDVIIDKQQELEEYSEQDYNYTSYTNWGPEAIDIGGYRQFLIDNSVEKEIVVVVMDTGINTSHPMFLNRLLTDEDGKIKGFSYYNSEYQYSYDNLSFDIDDENTTDIDETDKNKYSFEDDHGHGAHVAGIVCDLTPTNVKILPIKISGANGYSTTSVFISAYLRVINIYSKQYTIACTNLSFSGAGKSSESEKETFNEQCYEPLMNKNILPITAAGNDYAENNIEDLKAVVVSALKKQNTQYVFDNSYSNYGKIIDIAAPGSGIYSAGISDIDSADSSIVTKNGTSMASPQVAGVVALLYLNPNLPLDFTASDIEQMLYDNSLDMGTPNKDIFYGHGILNIKYFETDDIVETLSFYRDSNIVTEYIENENFEDEFVLEIKCSNPDFNIIYSTNRKIPTLSNSISYSSSILVNKSIYIFAMGVKLINGQIVERTNLFSISYFDISTPIEDCFTISSRGYLDNYTGNYTHLDIPKTLNGKTIVGLEPSLFKHSNIQSITLPDTLTTLGGYAFQYCDDLEYIYAPNLTKIYKAAFFGCYSLTEIFDRHPSSTEFVGAFFPNLTNTVGFTFCDCRNLESVSLSKLEDVGSLGGYDFYGCTNLKNIYLPLITSIPEGTFLLCESLTDTFHIGEFVNYIGTQAFSGCKIKLFTLDEDNKSFYTDGIGVYADNSLVAFACGNENIDYSILDSVIVDNQEIIITTITERVMANSNINNLTIPESISTINRFAFLNSQINTLYYNATNCSEAGYYDKEMSFRAQVFSNIGTIELGVSVEQVPERLFQDVFFDNLIINSKSTILTSASFYRMSEQGVLDKLYFNFTDEIDSYYLSMVVNTSCIFSYYDVNYIYSKTQVPIRSSSKLNKLIYSTIDGDYYIYSKEKLTGEFSIDASSNEFGRISPQGTINVNEGDSKKFTFIPNDGYKVKSIIVDGVALTGNDLINAIEYGYTFNNVAKNHTIEVSFEIKTYTITVVQAENGIISDAQEKYTYGSDAYFTIIPNVGYHVECLLIDGEIYPHSLTEYSFINITENHTISAKFARNTYTITASANSYGSITPSGIITTNYGDDKTFVFNAYVGYQVDKVYVDGINIGSVENYTFEDIEDNHTINVTFAKISYTITAFSGVNGDITPGGVSNVLYGESLNYTFTPNNGYKVKDVKVNNISIGAVNNYLFTNVTINQTISVEFEKIILKINIICGENGTVSPNGEMTVEYGASKTFLIVPNENYGISYIELNGERINITNTIIINNITEDQTLKVVFAQYFVITAVSGENGTITSSAYVTLGEQKRFDFYPNEGYRVKDVKIDSVSIGAVDYYTFVNIDASHTISVEYEVEKFNITLFKDGQGKINYEGTLENIVYGEKITFTINANNYWKIFKVYVNGETIDLVDGILTIDKVTEDINIQVIFKEDYSSIFSKENIIILALSLLGFTILTLFIVKSNKKLKSHKMNIEKTRQLLAEYRMRQKQFNNKEQNNEKDNPNIQ